MKNLLLPIAMFWMAGCSPNALDVLDGYSTEGLTYEDTSVYYHGKLAATLGSVEVAYDDGKLVREATFVLTSSEFNDIALNIIKLIYLLSENGNPFFLQCSITVILKYFCCNFLFLNLKEVSFTM